MVLTSFDAPTPTNSLFICSRCLCQRRFFDYRLKGPAIGQPDLLIRLLSLRRSPMSAEAQEKFAASLVSPLPLKIAIAGSLISASARDDALGRVDCWD